MVCFCIFHSSEVLTTSAVLVLDDTISIFEKKDSHMFVTGVLSLFVLEGAPNKNQSKSCSW